MEPLAAEAEAIDGAQGVEDVGLVLSGWGPCPTRGTCPGDLDHDGHVGLSDLLILLQR